MASTSKSKIVSCDVSSISFPSDSGHPEISDSATRNHVEQAAAALKANELVAFPTETVYGLGGSALAGSTAIPKIYKAKGRPSDNPLIVHIAHSKQLGAIVDPSQTPYLPLCYPTLMQKFWPGPLTLLYPTIPGQLVSENVTCGLETVGIRVPSHPIARALIALADVPVAAPSANTSGRPSPTAAKHVAHDLNNKDELAYILDGGDCSVGLESTVVSALRDKGKGKAPANGATTDKEILRVLRLGGVSPEELQGALVEAGLSELVEVQLEAPLGQEDSATSVSSSFIPSTPGMKYRHYSPDAKVILLQPSQDPRAHTIKDLLKSLKDKKIGLLYLASSPLATSVQESVSIVSAISLGHPSDYESHAQKLFGSLRALDEARVDVILVECIKEDGLGRTVMERLRKSAGGQDRVLVRLTS